MLRKWGLRTALLLSLPLLAVGVYATLLAVCGPPWPSWFPGPRTILERDRWDFGVVRPSENLTAQIRMGNFGQQRLVVREDRDNCESCSERPARTWVLEPGTTTRIELAAQAPASAGIMLDRHSFLTNDPKLTTFSVTLRATVERAEDGPGTKDGDR